MKTCWDCGLRKPLEEFSPNKRARDGRTTYCRPHAPAPPLPGSESRSTLATGAQRPCRSTHGEVASGLPRALAVGGLHPKSGRAGRPFRVLPAVSQRAGAQSLERNGGARSPHLVRRYGITGEEVDAMVEAQGGLCALCRERTPEHVDPDHLTT